MTVPVELLAALVLVVLFGILFGLVLWARGGAPHDDGTGSMYRDYLPDPADDDVWAAPPSALPSKLPGDEERGRPKRPPAPASGSDDLPSGSADRPPDAGR